MQTRQIAIYGAGGFGREVAWLIESCAAAGTDYRTVCFIDDDPANQGKCLNDIAVLNLGETKSRYPDAAVVSGVGNPRLRERLMEKAAAMGFSFETVIHPRVERSRRIEMGEGVMICAGNILTTNITLGHHVQINLDCTIGHDVVMGDYTTLAPGVHVSGWVHFGKRVYVGTGAVFINGTEEQPLIIGDDAVIGAGACVTKSVPPGETWGGGAGKTIEKALNSEDRFGRWQYPEIRDGQPTRYNWVVQHVAHFELGYKTDIGAFTYINAKHGVTVEDFVQIGSHCSIYSISTIDDKHGPVRLKKNCKVGSHSVVMPGVVIGENAVVGAFSFVNRDVPDGATVVGAPAREVRKPSGRQ